MKIPFTNFVVVVVWHEITCIRLMNMVSMGSMRCCIAIRVSSLTTFYVYQIAMLKHSLNVNTIKFCHLFERPAFDALQLVTMQVKHPSVVYFLFMSKWACWCWKWNEMKWKLKTAHFQKWKYPLLGKTTQFVQIICKMPRANFNYVRNKTGKLVNKQ